MANLILSVFRLVKKRSDILAFSIIFIVITLSSLSLLLSGDKLNFNDDFFQYASRHEAVRKGLLEHRTFPLRSYWFGGGYPTLGDPEDPSLNPLVLLSVFFGSIMGLKLIGFLAILIGGLSTYALARYILGYTRWGALFSGLIFSTSLFVPLRVMDGNPNEVYAAFLPLCMLLIGLALRGHKVALLTLPFVFYTMLSDGKLTFFMSIFYVGMFCLLDMVPVFSTFALQNSRRSIDIRPMKVFLLALVVTFFIGMIRILPAFELINTRGGFGQINVAFHPKTYSPGSIIAYTFQRLWQEAIAWKGRLGLVTIGWLPIILFGIALLVFWRRSLPWAINLCLFGWLLLAHNAPVDLLKLFWKLPIFNAMSFPYKYFSFQISFTVAVASGQFFWLLTRLRPGWLRHLCAVILVMAGVWFLYPKMVRIQRDTYNFETPAEFLIPEEEFFNVKGQNLERIRKEPLRSVTYLNLLRNVGTIDWYTGMPIAENAIPKYFVDEKNKYIPNPDYGGEVFFLERDDLVKPTSPLSSIVNTAKSTFHPNSIVVEVYIQKPCVLVINQNYHRDWHSNEGWIFNMKGLIALQLEKTGAYIIRMRYLSRSFYAGLIISILSISALAFISWAYMTKRLLCWSQHASPFIRHISRAALWLTDV